MTEQIVKLVANDDSEFRVPPQSLRHCRCLQQKLLAQKTSLEVTLSTGVDGDLLRLLACWLEAHANDDPEDIKQARLFAPFHRHKADRELLHSGVLEANDRLRLMRAAKLLDAPALVDAIMAEEAAVTKNRCLEQMTAFVEERERRRRAQNEAEVELRRLQLGEEGENEEVTVEPDEEPNADVENERAAVAFSP